jgi:hypothetical protein
VNLGQTAGADAAVPLQSLVHDRTRRSALIILAAFAFFFIWDYAGGIPSGLADRIVFASHTLVVVLAAVASAILFWTRELAARWWDDHAPAGCAPRATPAANPF